MMITMSIHVVVITPCRANVLVLALPLSLRLYLRKHIKPSHEHINYFRTSKPTLISSRAVCLSIEKPLFATQDIPLAFLLKNSKYELIMDKLL